MLYDFLKKNSVLWQDIPDVTHCYDFAFLPEFLPQHWLIMSEQLMALLMNISVYFVEQSAAWGRWNIKLGVFVVACCEKNNSVTTKSTSRWVWPEVFIDGRNILRL